jgi:polyphosphate kinase
MGNIVNLDDPELYLNRELGWVQFNERVLEEAEDPTHPLLERVKFFAICGSNLDEFFMVRISGLQRQLKKPVTIPPQNGLTPEEAIEAIRQRLKPLLDRYDHCWNRLILPDLQRSGIRIRKIEELSGEQRASLRKFFDEEIFPTLTPLAFDLTHPFPFISNLSVNLAVELRTPGGGKLFSRIKIPKGLFPRFIPVPDPRETGDRGVTDRLLFHYVLIEDLIRANLDLLFPGIEVVACYPFRITRDADIDIREDEAHDLMSAIEESMEMRRIGAPVRLEVDASLPERISHELAIRLGLSADFIHRCCFPLGMADLSELTSVPRPDLKDLSFLPLFPPGIGNPGDLFAEVRKRDQLFYHPYDSFVPFIDLLQAAARDPRVLCIKITLYRIDDNSPIVAALQEAREQGKQVTAVVELKARFEERKNISWARALAKSGVHVVYGVVGLKVHAKACLIVRREREGIIRYVHLSTGNYNAVTTRIYGDLGLLTTDPAIGADVTDFFNALTGYSLKERYREILVAPETLREDILRRIEREIERHLAHGDGYLAFKFNALEDRECIKALYRASMAGVRVDLNVRGFCCLRPGIPGVSDHIRVISIVDRFLEHARVYYFHNGGDPEMLLGSADLRPRNLDRRVEVLFPVRDPGIRDAILTTILRTHLSDTVKARELQSDGEYNRVEPGKDRVPLRSQAWLVEHRGAWHRR